MTSKDEKAIDRTLTAMNRSFDEFFSVVRYAIVRWADIDREFFRLCQFALHTDETKTSVVFYHSQTIGAHLALVDRLMKCSLSPVRLAHWKRLHDTAQELVPFRNELAHNSAGRNVRVTIPPPHGGEGTTRIWWSSRPDTAKRLSKPNRRAIEIEAQHVREHIDKVNDLLIEMTSFREALPKRALKKLLEPS